MHPLESRLFQKIKDILGLNVAIRLLWPSQSQDLKPQTIPRPRPPSSTDYKRRHAPSQEKLSIYCTVHTTREVRSNLSGNSLF
ncbi:hypothetical protein KGM_209300 [Danaus plexippus plexippus]|uniref:Uncharacterized protein n=1 Tax=Danaus plexippus plexippus TaxID=278856 RepID=A0A212EL68_DANPL|nr:hypothetical protein KGM_209300 [Danaus plexippus plexippus]